MIAGGNCDQLRRRAAFIRTPLPEMRITLQNRTPLCPYGEPRRTGWPPNAGQQPGRAPVGRSIPVDLLLAIGEVVLVFACLLGLVHVADRVWRRRRR